MIFRDSSALGDTRVRHIIDVSVLPRRYLYRVVARQLNGLLTTRWGLVGDSVTDRGDSVKRLGPAPAILVLERSAWYCCEATPARTHAHLTKRMVMRELLHPAYSGRITVSRISLSARILSKPPFHMLQLEFSYSSSHPQHVEYISA